MYPSGKQYQAVSNGLSFPRSTAALIILTGPWDSLINKESIQEHNSCSVRASDIMWDEMGDPRKMTNSPTLYQSGLYGTVAGWTVSRAWVERYSALNPLGSTPITDRQIPGTAHHLANIISAGGEAWWCYGLCHGAYFSIRDKASGRA